MTTFCKFGGGGGKTKVFIDPPNPTARTITYDISEYNKIVWVLGCVSQSGNTSSVSVKLRNKQGKERIIYSNNSLSAGGFKGVVDVENDTHIIYSRTHNYLNQTNFTVCATTDDELIV